MVATWVDLKGETGDTGADGTAGTNGNDGADGIGVEVSETEPVTPVVGGLWFKASTSALQVCTAV